MSDSSFHLQFKFMHHEVDNVYTFWFAADVKWRAGQYMAIVFPDISQHLSEYEHWFTISSAPYQRDIAITVRQSSSKFKQRLFELKPGESIIGHTIDGDFGWPTDSWPIMFAGGIGITPFISMLRQRQHEQREIKAKLYYYTRPGTSILFKSELERIASDHSLFDIVYMEEKPLRLPGNFDWFVKDKPPAYVAGPVPMVDRMGVELESKGIKVYKDFYFGYDIRNY